jgi:hypothetical protein
VYGSLWRRLPGPWPIKLIESAVLLAGVVALLFVVVFPWLEPRLPFTDVTVDNQPGSDTVDPNNPTGPAGVPSTPAPADGGSPVLGAGSIDVGSDTAARLSL